MMTSFLSCRNRDLGDKFVGVQATKNLRKIKGMKDAFQEDFARRLRAAMRAAGIPTAKILAALINQGDSRVRNWVNGTSTPPVRDSVLLAQALGVTLDWLYRERVEGLPEGKRIRLVAAIQGINPPPTLSEEDLDAEASEEAQTSVSVSRQSARQSSRRSKKASVGD